MSSYFGINIRLKLKKDAPKEIQQFMDTAFIEADLEGAIAAFEHTPFDEKHLVSLQSLKRYDELGNLRSMILQKYTGYPTWCWRVKEEASDHCLYETRGCCKGHRADSVLLMILVGFLAPYLILDDEDILVREIGEDNTRERVLVIDPTLREANWFDGYKYKTYRGDLHDGDHPSERYGRVLLSDEPNANQQTRLNADLGEFVPPWTYKTLETLNAANKKEWDEEASASWW